ncbi:MAG: sodium:dicarboxylate symporter, partial [Lacunisphaera sp.]|nr:sodium:dicarboxylate symporter [Lacunisphaera sp.]
MSLVDSPPSGQPSLWQRYRALSFGIKMLIFLVVGVLAGLGLGERVLVVQPVGDLFIRLLVLVALPLVFFNLLAGITSAGDARVLGRLGMRTMAFYLSTMLVALALGLTATHLLQPGLNMPLKGVVSKEFAEVPQIGQLLFDLVPTNVFQSFAAGKVTQVVIFGILLGVTTLFMPAAQRERLAGIFSLLAETFRRMVGVVLLMGPIGVGALAACTVAQYGTKLFGPLF